MKLKNSNCVETKTLIVKEKTQNLNCDKTNIVTKLKL